MRQFLEGEQSHLVPGGPRTHVLKAVVEGRKEPIGFAIVRVFSGGRVQEGVEKEGGGTPEKKVISSAKGVDLDCHIVGEHEGEVEDELNYKFFDEWRSKMKDLYEKYMDGKEHACEYNLAQYYAMHSRYLSPLRQIWAS